MSTASWSLLVFDRFSAGSPSTAPRSTRGLFRDGPCCPDPAERLGVAGGDLAGVAPEPPVLPRGDGVSSALCCSRTSVARCPVEVRAAIAALRPIDILAIASAGASTLRPLGICRTAGLALLSADSAADSAVQGRQGSVEAALPTVGSRHAQPGNHGTSLSDPAATLATVSFHKVEHLCQVPLDGSDALLAQTCSAFFNASAGAPPDESWTAGPGSRARTCSLRQNGCRYYAERVDGRGALGLDAR